MEWTRGLRYQPMASLLNRLYSEAPPGPVHRGWCVRWPAMFKNKQNSPPLTRITTSSLAGSLWLSTKVKKRCFAPISTYPVYALPNAGHVSEFQFAQGQNGEKVVRLGGFAKQRRLFDSYGILRECTVDQGIEGAPSCVMRGDVPLFFETWERLTGGCPWVQHHATNRVYEERCQENQHGRTQRLIRQRPSDW